MNNDPNLVRKAAHFTPFLLLGIFTAAQWDISAAFDGKDYTDRIISILLIPIIGLLAQKFKSPRLYTLCVLILLSIFHQYATLFVYQRVPFISTYWFYFLSFLFIYVSLSLAPAFNFSPRYLFKSSTALVLGIILSWVLVDFWFVFTFALLGLILFVWLSSSVYSRIQYYVLGILLLVTSVSHIIAGEAKVSPRQFKYFDPVVYSLKTAFQQYDITHWQGHYWFFSNEKNQFSTYDSWLYFEPFIIPSLCLSQAQKVLVVGGENGMCVDQLLRAKKTCTIDILPLDTAMISAAKRVPILTHLNHQSLLSNQVTINSTSDIFFQLYQNTKQYDLIVIDLPDPRGIEVNQYYTKEFYQLCYQALGSDGVLVTQSGSPYFATEAFNIINNTISVAGFFTTQYHNQIMTAGEWGWTMAKKSPFTVSDVLHSYEKTEIQTHWLNKESIEMMFAFGKSYVEIEQVETNSIFHTTLYKKYVDGNWSLE